MNKLPKIKVIGVGGSGSNAVSRMMQCNIRGVELIAINTDVQDLKKTKAHKKIRIGQNLTKGLGTGMDPNIGRLAAEEQKEEIEQAIAGSDIVFITCGLGGGTGTGAAPTIAEIAKKSGALTLAVVTTPFAFEGNQRKIIAHQGKKELKDKVDTLISISNDKLFSVLDMSVSVSSAFWYCDEILRQAVQGISDLIILPGIVNIDFADVKTILKDSGTAIFGIGKAKGDKRGSQAALSALNSPLLGLSYQGAKGVLFNVSGGKDINLSEVDEIARTITEKVSPEAKIIFGAIQDEKLKKGEIKVTIIVTGF